MQVTRCSFIFCRYGAGKVSSGANVDGAPAPEEFEENGKEEEVGEFGFHTLVRLLVLCSKQQLINAGFCGIHLNCVWPLNLSFVVSGHFEAASASNTTADINNSQVLPRVTPLPQ